MPAIQAAEGCESYQLFQSQDDPTKFIGIETWTSIEAHRASVKKIPTESISEFMKLVAGPPSGGYYRRLSTPAAPASGG
jgi:quinol monooxygenase YgiN